MYWFSDICEWEYIHDLFHNSFNWNIYTNIYESYWFYVIFILWYLDESVDHFQKFSGKFLRYFMYNIISSMKRDNLTFSFPILSFLFPFWSSIMTTSIGMPMCTGQLAHDSTSRWKATERESVSCKHDLLYKCPIPSGQL